MYLTFNQRPAIYYAGCVRVSQFVEDKLFFQIPYKSRDERRKIYERLKAQNPTKIITFIPDEIL